MAIVSGGKDAHTEFYPLHTTGAWTLVKAIPHTGRTHQIRVHLTALGYPILGDTLYGKRGAEWKGLRQMLHCWSVTCVHPVTKASLVLQAPIPSDMREILGKNVCV